MSRERFEYLFSQHVSGLCSKHEEEEFMQLAGQNEYQPLLEDLIHDLLKKMPGTIAMTEGSLQSILEAIFQAATAPVISIKKKRYGPLAVAAAVIILFLSAGAYLLFNHTSQQDSVADKPAKQLIQDVPPPNSSNAVLTLANGQQIILDSASNGSLAMQGNTNVVKLADGQIVYNGKAAGEMQYNILTVPKGSRIANITLADGSKVWLNSESSLKYPVAFAGNERKVEIIGEAYFEVTKVSSSVGGAMPFKVQKGEMQVTVLGTQFNVNAYDDEAAVKVTLLEGSVKIKKGNAASLLKPGQQARITSDIKTGDDVDMDEVMAWKNGKFQFGEAMDIPAIMRQIARWYDVDVEYRGVLTGHIGGTISRNENASQVFKMLEMTGAVRVKIEGKKIIVMPK